MCAYFCYAYASWLLLTWVPTYLMEYRGLTLLKMGFFAALPYAAGVIGNTVGGMLSDWILKKTGRFSFSRRIVAAPCLLGAIICIVPAATTDNVYVAVACLTATTFFLETTIGPAWAVVMDVGGEYSGTVSGIMNAAGMLGGTIASASFGYIVKYTGWVMPFIIAAIILLIGAATWSFWLNPEVSVVNKKNADVSATA